ncbi:hypothetical protein TARUN_7666 [Trichoderma arundinaceum]|uniref:Uncharacterized protein n=1 Tax=Trichoderma arundinaceum TaxID=490622 RepID=A0A395NEM2_TRIAR|nr:hypothetical protein TARUN_7666 [Trichoderma arundinaceum]
MKPGFFIRTLLRCAKKTRRHLSRADQAQLFLNYDVLHIILTEHMDKYKDILNFVLANKLYFRLFSPALLRHNVRHDARLSHGPPNAATWPSSRRYSTLQKWKSLLPETFGSRRLTSSIGPDI